MIEQGDSDMAPRTAKARPATPRRVRLLIERRGAAAVVLIPPPDADL